MPKREKRRAGQIRKGNLETAQYERGTAQRMLRMGMGFEQEKTEKTEEKRKVNLESAQYERGTTRCATQEKSEVHKHQSGYFPAMG
jgi:hypothetical protein